MENTNLNNSIPEQNSGQMSTTTTALVAQVHFVQKSSDNKCNGKVHRQLRYCQRPAGWGTNHVGNGRCKLHGGCEHVIKSGQLRYSDFVPSTIVEKYEEFSQEDAKDIKSLNDEIALIRAKITDLETKNLDGSWNKDLMQFIELIRRLVETKDKLECGIKTKTTVEVVFRFVDTFIAIIEKHVSDVSTKKAIATEMRRLNFSQLGMN